MRFITFHTDDEAISPALGVVLMVVITVLLAAVIGTFMLGFAEEMGEPAPAAYLTHDYDADDGNVTIVHEAGDSIDSDRLYVRVEGVGQAAWHEGDPGTDPGEKVRVGRSFETAETDAIPGSIEPGTTVRVIWVTDGGGGTTLYSWGVG